MFLMLLYEKRNILTVHKEANIYYVFMLYFYFNLHRKLSADRPASLPAAGRAEPARHWREHDGRAQEDLQRHHQQVHHVVGQVVRRVFLLQNSATRPKNRAIDSDQG